MAASSYDESLRRLLAHEGGYTNHPADPGGPTNFGITIYDYRKYVKPNATAADVRAMKVEEAKAIYRAKYWDAQRCDELPAGVDYAVFDYGVNSGIGRSKKVLQRVLGVADDGALGAETMRAVQAYLPSKIIIDICDERLRFLQRLHTWPVFGRGWGRRVAEVKSVALAMAANSQLPSAAVAPASGRAVVPVSKPMQQASAATAIAAGAAAAQQAHQAGHPIWVVACIAGIALGAAAGVWLFWRARHKQQQEKSGMMWDKIKAWFKHSVTILWARVLMLFGIISAAIANIGGIDIFHGAISDKVWPWVAVGFGMITELARRRTAGKA